MEPGALAPQNALVDRLLREHVPEGEFLLRNDPLLVDEPAFLQLPEPLFECRRFPQCGFEQPPMEDASNNRRILQHALQLRLKAVHAAEDHSLNALWHLQLPWL